MRHEEAFRPRRLERIDGLVEREVTARLAVELSPQEGRLAHEEVGIAGALDELVAGRGVARIREHSAVGADTEGVRLEPVVRDAGRRDLELAYGERRIGLVFREVEGSLEHVREAEPLAERGRNSAPPGCTQSAGFRSGPFDER